MSMASTQNLPRGEAIPRPPFLEMAGTSHHPALRVHPVPALNLPQRQRRGTIPAWGHRPRNNAPINGPGPTARPRRLPRTTTTRDAHPRPAAYIVEPSRPGRRGSSSDSRLAHVSPIRKSAIQQVGKPAVRQRNMRTAGRRPARARQNHTLPHSFHLPDPSHPPRPETRDPRLCLPAFFRLPTAQSPEPKACFSPFNFQTRSQSRATHWQRLGKPNEA